MFATRIAAALLLTTIASVGARAETKPHEPCAPSVEASRELVMAFYTQALIEKRPRAAFERYVSAEFVEHKPDIPGGGRSAVADFLEAVIKELPDARWEIVRTVAERDFVFLHARFTPAPGAPPYAIADIFRIEDCTILEHWDVVGPPRDGQPNPKSRF